MPPTLMPPTLLPLFDRVLLGAIAKLVPIDEREDWSRGWHAELWHLHHRSCGRGARALMTIADISLGLTRDAIWPRGDSWRRTWSGTAGLCLGSLFGLCMLSAMIAAALDGGLHSLSFYSAGQFDRSLIAAPLIVFVTLATASRRHFEPVTTGKRLFRIKRHLFQAMKIAEVLLLAFLLSVDVCQPIHGYLPNTADVIQILSFVLIALVGLRWGFRDLGAALQAVSAHACHTGASRTSLAQSPGVEWHRA